MLPVSRWVSCRESSDLSPICINLLLQAVPGTLLNARLPGRKFLLVKGICPAVAVQALQGVRRVELSGLARPGRVESSWF